MLGEQIGNIVGRLDDGSKRRQECHGEVIVGISWDIQKSEITLRTNNT